MSHVDPHPDLLDPDAERLELRLRALAADVSPPPTPRGEDRRAARRALVRRRTAAGACGVAAAAAAAVAVALVLPVGRTTTVTPADLGNRLGLVPVAPDGLPSMPAGVLKHPVESGAAWPTSFSAAERRTNADLIEPGDLALRLAADRLDPERDHVGPFSFVGGSSEPAPPDGVYASAPWVDEQGRADGRLAVSVTPFVDRVDCDSERLGPGAACRTLDPPAGAVRAITFSSGDTTPDTWVVVEHASGLVIALVSTPGATGDGPRVDDQEWAAVAADPAFEKVLDPGVEISPTLDREAFVQVGAQTLVRPGERFEPTYRDFEVSGPWGEPETGDRTLRWSTISTNGVPDLRLCDDPGLRQLTSCEDRATAGGALQISVLDQTRTISLTGQVRSVSVQGPLDFPVDRAVDFVTDSRWQAR